MLSLYKPENRAVNDEKPQYIASLLKYLCLHYIYILFIESYIDHVRFLAPSKSFGLRKAVGKHKFCTTSFWPRSVFQLTASAFLFLICFGLSVLQGKDCLGFLCMLTAEVSGSAEVFRVLLCIHRCICNQELISISNKVSLLSQNCKSS